MNAGGAERLLREHVTRIVGMSGVPRSERDDVAEELYGHLWQRWHERVNAGEDEVAAAQGAIESFGRPDRLASEMTEAFHSRLYATTIGVLLPLAAPAANRPIGFTRSRILLGLLVLFQVVGSLGFIAGQTPLRAAITAVLVAFGIAITVVAYKALDRRQRWALVFVQLVAVATILFSIAQVVLTPITINFLGLFAIYVFPATRRPAFRAWVADSRPVRGALAGLLVATIAIQFLTPYAIAAVPDPTVASPADLSISVHATCTESDGVVKDGSVETTLRWARTDMFPGGWRPWGMASSDFIGLSVADSIDVIEGSTERPHFPDQSSPWPSAGAYFAGQPSLSEPATGRSIDNVNVVSSDVRPWFSTTGTATTGIDPTTMRAGSTYLATFPFLRQAGAPVYPDPPGTVLPVFRIRYDHQGRFGLEAIARCGETVTAHAVDRDPPGSAGVTFR